MKRERVWEIDLLRVGAIFLMMVFHFVYDLNEYLGVEVDYSRGFWFWIGKASALTFIFLSGISSGFSRKGVCRRGLLVLGVGLGITAVTYFSLGDIYIRYGILHFLGTSMLLFPLLKKLDLWVLAVLSAVIAWLAGPISNCYIRTGLLLPLGIKYRGFQSADYYPLFPYLAVFILGVIAFKVYYYKRQSLFNFRLENRIITVLSKNSLLIYVIHQPIFLGAIMLYKYVSS
jgi:uncharacterized membrane protein